MIKYSHKDKLYAKVYNIAKKERYMNSVVLIGRLARDPELSYTPNTQNAVCRFTLAVDRPKRQSEDAGADFIRIVVWGKSGEACNRYLAKGSQVAVRGRIETGSYKDRDGKTVYTTDVVAEAFNGVEFLGGGNGNAGSGNGRSNEGNYRGNSGRSGNGYAREPQQESFDPEPTYDDLPESFSMQDDDEPF